MVGTLEQERKELEERLIKLNKDLEILNKQLQQADLNAQSALFTGLHEPMKTYLEQYKQLVTEAKKLNIIGEHFENHYITDEYINKYNEGKNYTAHPIDIEKLKQSPQGDRYNLIMNELDKLKKSRDQQKIDAINIGALLFSFTVIGGLVAYIVWKIMDENDKKHVSQLNMEKENLFTEYKGEKEQSRTEAVNKDPLREKVFAHAYQHNKTFFQSPNEESSDQKETYEKGSSNKPS